MRVVGEADPYVIRGGVEGRERLRLMSRVLSESTTRLFDRVGIPGDISCLDAGCGGGDVTIELARRIGPGGSVLGIDMDATKIDLARREASSAGLTNVEFAVGNVTEARFEQRFDLVYARFLLTHLQDPSAMVRRFGGWLRPGGRVVVEDIDFSGYFVYPDSPAFRRYHALYCEAVRRKGADPDIGPRLPWLLKEAAFIDVGVSIAQPVGLEGEVKLITPLTMENIADTVVSLGLSSRDEVATLVQELYAFAADPNTLGGTPRIVQAWGRRNAHA